MAKKTDDVEETKRLMGALVRMKPKPHEAMKIKKTKIMKKRVASSKPKSA